MLINNIDYKTLNDVILNFRSEDKKGITFISGDQKEKFVTYNELYAKALSVLYVLQENGVKPGQEAVFQIDNNESFITFFWACILGGIVPVPVTLGLNEEQKLKLCKIWSYLNNPVLITVKKVHETFIKFLEDENFIKLKETIQNSTIIIDELKYDMEKGDIYNSLPENIAFIQFSSGSTGDPKGVVLTHANLLANIQGIVLAIELNQKDSTLSWMPLTHDLGLIALHITPFTTGSNQYIMPTALFIRRPTLWLKKADEHAVTILSSPNFGYQYFMKFYKRGDNFKWDLSKIRSICNAAEPISVKLANEFLDLMSKHGLNRKSMLPVYGLAEASVGCCFSKVDEGLTTVTVQRDLLSVGQHVKYVDDRDNGITLVELGYPIKNCFVKIFDSENRELAEDTVGHIKIKGKNVTSGYYNNKAATADVMDNKGWLNTKDLGFMRNGNLIVTGRAKDIIFVNGANYYSYDLENMLYDVSGLELGKVAIGGVYNNDTEKEEIIVFVIHKGSIKEFINTACNIKKVLMKKLGINAKEVVPVNRLPKTTSGKVQRYKLIDRYKDGEFLDLINEIHKLTESEAEGEWNDEPTNEIERNLSDICKEIFKVSKVGRNKNIIEIGADSILLNQIYSKVEELYPERLSITDFFSYPTIAQLANHISHGGGRPIVPLNLEKKYFNSEDEVEEKTTYRFEFTGDVWNKMKSICKTQNIKEEEMLLALFMYTISNVSETKNINVQTMLAEYDEVIPITIDFNNIDNFSEIFRLISKYGKYKTASYKVSNVNAIDIRKTDREVVPLFYEIKLSNEKINLIDIYDIILGIIRKDECIQMNFEYSNVRLRKDMMKDMFNKYISVVTTLVNKLYLMWKNAK